MFPEGFPDQKIEVTLAFLIILQKTYQPVTTFYTLFIRNQTAYLGKWFLF